MIESRLKRALRLAYVNGHYGSFAVVTKEHCSGCPESKIVFHKDSPATSMPDPNSSTCESCLIKRGVI